MDESLTDFQDKKSFKGPKIVKAAAKPKPKAKKAVKRIKGQKDIRAALKKKKDDLIAHAEAFDRECKKSGIDVDSEELQVAIALSKSLQPAESEDKAASSQSVTAQIRAGLIRSNLEAFGFKVPKTKPSTSRKSKKRRKPYKLLLTTEEQKQQLISDRYSQLLFELNNSVSASNNTELDITNLFIYNMATNIEYEDIKDDEVFYVENLVEKSSNSMGCQLKNCSDIPGRPLSPTQDKSETMFSEIECSQDEVDIVLSGSLKFSRDILKRKYLYKRKTRDHSIVEEVIDETHQEIDPVVIEECNDIHLSLDVATVSSDDNDNSGKKDTPIEIIEMQDKLLLMVPKPVRSLSPDLFDDDEDTVVENNSEIVIESPLKLTCNVTKQTSDVMDLTECVNVISQKCINNSRTKKPLSQLSQEDDVTKRKSNDFMEITECVGVSSQRVLEKIDEHIDLTAHCDIDIVAEKDCLIFDNVEHMDLTQSSNTSTDTLPFVSITGKDKEQDKSLDDTIILNDNDYLAVKSPIINTDIDIADKPEMCTTKIYTSPKVAVNVSFPVISGEATKETSVINLDESCEVNALEEEDNVDLTQTSESNDEETSDAPNNNATLQKNNSSLGKKDDISVDYDEALENMNTISYCAIDTNLNDDNRTNLAINHLGEPNEEFVSKSAEVLEVSDTEVNSPNKNENAQNNFDCGGISVIENLPSFNRISRNTLHSIANGSVNDSLPLVDIKGKQTPVKPRSPFEEFLDPITDPISNKNLVNNECTATQTPKGASNYVNVQTPKQTEYIVKTDNVTPMLDYAAMSSPERNKELDKYGLKPFKRKRAIQLLTHLYNQTHPYIESSEELPSPSKRQKQDTLSQPSTSEPSRNTRRINSRSPRKTSKSPRKSSKSPRKCEDSSKDSGSLNLSDKENDMFTVTRDVPIIRNIECDADDWVFQKREKAKLYSCRVPLHVAFHNYVSCRSRLHEAILRYEPVSIDVIHKGLAASGHRYDPKDLLRFMDKKCITVKTAENAKNRNHY